MSCQEKHFTERNRDRTNERGMSDFQNSTGSIWAQLTILLQTCTIFQKKKKKNDSKGKVADPVVGASDHRRLSLGLKTNRI